MTCATWKPWRWTNLGIGAVFATLVMFLFLRSARITAVGVIGIPICTIAAFPAAVGWPHH